MNISSGRENICSNYCIVVLANTSYYSVISTNTSPGVIDLQLVASAAAAEVHHIRPTLHQPPPTIVCCRCVQPRPAAHWTWAQRQGHAESSSSTTRSRFPCRLYTPPTTPSSSPPPLFSCLFASVVQDVLKRLVFLLSVMFKSLVL